eukprot:jgi/Tetstr1/426468/TSEL_016769.t1
MNMRLLENVDEEVINMLDDALAAAIEDAGAIAAGAAPASSLDEDEHTASRTLKTQDRSHGRLLKRQGYGRWAKMAQQALREQLPGLVVELIKDAGATGNFEIVCVNTGALLHSKSKNGQGFLDEPAKVAAVVEAIKKVSSA